MHLLLMHLQLQVDWCMLPSSAQFELGSQVPGQVWERGNTLMRILCALLKPLVAGGSATCRGICISRFSFEGVADYGVNVGVLMVLG